MATLVATGGRSPVSGSPYPPQGKRCLHKHSNHHLRLHNAGLWYLLAASLLMHASTWYGSLSDMWFDIQMKTFIVAL